jgi:iron complex transport system permease protein
MILPARHARLALPIAVALLVAAAAASLAFGEARLGPARLLQGLLRHDEFASTILWQIRLPRMAVGILVGAALASAGLIMQAYFRNSLASPDLLGVSTGGAAGAAIAIAAGWAAASLWALPATALVGSFAAVGAVLTLARRGASTERLLLAGVALNALLGAVTAYILTRYTDTYARNTQILFWLMGGLEDRMGMHVLIALPIPLAALALRPLGRQMDLLSLGENEAQSLGVDVGRLRRRLIVIATVMTATAAAIAGTIGFVGLIVPHILRLLVGPEHRRLVPLALVCGPGFVLVCDLLGRLAGDLRLGIVTALIGGPFFLWLLRRHP